jgi:hypothetical protein
MICTMSDFEAEEGNLHMYLSICQDPEQISAALIS